jgi:hypothetical protein
MTIVSHNPLLVSKPTRIHGPFQNTLCHGKRNQLHSICQEHSLFPQTLPLTIGLDESPGILTHTGRISTQADRHQNQHAIFLKKEFVNPTSNVYEGFYQPLATILKTHTNQPFARVMIWNVSNHGLKVRFGPIL